MSKTGHFRSETCGTLGEIMELCLNLREDGFWSFRGQRKEHWNLGLHNVRDVRWLDEHVRQFKKRCMETVSSPYMPEDHHWRWLFFAQHYRLKTRLLDWTTNPLVAIYFAVENILSKGNDHDDFGAVWALKVADKHFRSPEELKKDPEELNEWLLVNPPPITSRLSRQSGKFTFHPGDNLQPLEAMPRRNKHEEIVKITLRGSKGRNPAAEIRRRLGILNVHHAALFPDPDGIAVFLNHEWREIADPEFLRLLSNKKMPTTNDLLEEQEQKIEEVRNEALGNNETPL